MYGSELISETFGVSGLHVLQDPSDADDFSDVDEELKSEEPAAPKVQDEKSDEAEDDFPPNPDCPFLCEHDGEIILGDMLISKMVVVPQNKCKDWVLSKASTEGGVEYILDSRSKAEGAKPKIVSKLFAATKRAKDLTCLSCELFHVLRCIVWLQFR